MHLVLIDTDEDLGPLHVIRYGSGLSLSLLIRNVQNHVYVPSKSNLKTKIGAAFPYKRIRIVDWDDLVSKHRYEFYLYEYVQYIEQWKEIIFY